MSTSNSHPLPPRLLIGAIVLIFLAAAALWGAARWTAHEQSATRTNLAAGYDAHALTPPFQLQSRSWLPAKGAFQTSGAWQYQYRAGLSGPAAVAAARSQLSRGGYQVVATHPDAAAATATHATLYRDLITGDVSLTVQIQTASGATYTTGPVAVTVTVVPLAGE